MSMATEAARGEFDRAMQDPNNLIDIHKSLNAAAGRRFREVTINRAVVVLTVAAWQAFIEDTAEAILTTIEPPSTQQPHRELWVLINAATRAAIGRFNTPNVTNSLNLLANVGFDPSRSWAWGWGHTASTPAQVSNRMNQWLTVRHCIAHGAPLPMVDVISRTPAGIPSITRANAEACRDLFTRASHATADAANVVFP